MCKAASLYVEVLYDIFKDILSAYDVESCRINIKSHISACKWMWFGRYYRHMFNVTFVGLFYHSLVSRLEVASKAISADLQAKSGRFHELFKAVVYFRNVNYLNRKLKIILTDDPEMM